VSLPSLRDFTVPLPGSTTSRSVLSRMLRRALRDLIQLDPKGVSPPTGELLRRARAHLRTILDENEAALTRAVRDPGVGAWVRRLRGREPKVAVDLGVRKLFGTLWLDLALARALASPARVPSPGWLVSVAHRVGLEVAEGTEIVFDNGIVRANGQDVELDRRAFASLACGPVLVLVDDDGQAEGRGRFDLGGRPAGVWVRAIDQAAELIAAHLPELRIDLERFVQQIVPVAASEGGDGGDPDIGSVCLAFHADAVVFAEELIRGLCRAKLAALFELDPLVTGTAARGVLAGVYSGLAAEQLYSRMTGVGHPFAARPEFADRLARVRVANRELSREFVRVATPTRSGAELIGEFERLIG
jgi:HEXXH motif-containing protein